MQSAMLAEHARRYTCLKRSEVWQIAKDQSGSATKKTNTKLIMFARHSKWFQHDNMTECNVCRPWHEEKHLERTPEVAARWWVITPGVERGPWRPNSRKCTVSIDFSLGGYVFIMALSWDYLIILLGRMYALYKHHPKDVLRLRDWEILVDR